jgi:signal transduction histidine kinase
VTVRAADGHVAVRVEDDGIGVDPEHARGGLANLRERAHDLGGTFDIRPGLKAGTDVEGRVPLTD